MLSQSLAHISFQTMTAKYCFQGRGQSRYLRITQLASVLLEFTFPVWEFVMQNVLFESTFGRLTSEQSEIYFCSSNVTPDISTVIALRQCHHCPLLQAFLAGRGSVCNITQCSRLQVATSSQNLPTHGNPVLVMQAVRHDAQSGTQKMWFYFVGLNTLECCHLLSKQGRNHITNICYESVDSLPASRSPVRYPVFGV